MNLLFLPDLGEIEPLPFFYKDRFGFKLPTNVDMRLNKVVSRVRHETPEAGQRTYRPKRCVYNNQDEVNSPNIQNEETNPSFTSYLLVI